MEGLRTLSFTRESKVFTSALFTYLYAKFSGNAANYESVFCAARSLFIFQIGDDCVVQAQWRPPWRRPRRQMGTTTHVRTLTVETILITITTTTTRVHMARRPPALTPAARITATTTATTTTRGRTPQPLQSALASTTLCTHAAGPSTRNA
jgi:hypothetical protein